MTLEPALWRLQDVVGCLEYDPELPVRQHYRQYLQQGVVFKEVVPISSPNLRAKIHQTYRMGYLKVRSAQSCPVLMLKGPFLKR